jgi:O-antigen/teichoic acid export membrane protein
VKKADIHRYGHLFDTKHLKAQLKDKAVRGGFSIMAAGMASFVLHTGSMVILARILMPEHFGLIGMVTAVTSIAEKFKDVGLSTATVQREKITHEQVTALFWINVGFGALLMAIVAALAWVIAWFFADHRLIGITLAISSSLFLGGLTVQHQALLQRQMRFGKLAWIQIVSDGLSIAMVLDWLGRDLNIGPWSGRKSPEAHSSGRNMVYVPMVAWVASQGHRVGSNAPVWKGYKRS